MRSLTMTVLAICLAALPAFSAALGDPAPPLSIGTWIQGGPVEVGEGKGVVVVEFWATWCPPCRESIPHLTELQKQYAGQGVTFVGISDEPEATVRPFVEQMGDRMGYAVALDDDGKTGEAYMAAFGIGGIPHAFLVNNLGQIAWEGHPMELDTILPKVLDGTFDGAKQKAAEQAKALFPIFAYLLQAAPEPDIALLVGQRMLEHGVEDFEVLRGMVVIPCMAAKDNAGLMEVAAKALGKLEETRGDEDWEYCRLAAMMAYQRGVTDEAVRLQERAVSLAEGTDPNTKEQLRSELQHYIGSVSVP